MLEFTDKKTAASFEALTETDQFVHVPARAGQGECYRGPLSNIDAEAAARYVRFGGNLLKEKAAPDKPVVSTK